MSDVTHTTRNVHFDSLRFIALSTFRPPTKSPDQNILSHIPILPAKLIVFAGHSLFLSADTSD
jgi:hypothetical protein